MFHLFNKVYLEHELHFNSIGESITLAKEEKEHPVSLLAGMSIGRVLAFDDYLKEKHQGSLNDFWKFLINQSSERQFTVYTDSEIYLKLQFQFWRNIFADPGPDFLHFLYKFYYQDARLKEFKYVYRGLNRFGNKIAHFKKFTDAEFRALYKEIEEIPALQAMDKSAVSFEYLMANYFYDKHSYYAPAFLTKLKDICWKKFFNDAEEMRSEIINSFYDINQIFPDLKITFEDYDEVENHIKKEPMLRWILDPEFNDRNIAYVLRTYPWDIFPKLQSEIDRVSRVKVTLRGKEIKDIDVFNLASQTEQLFTGQYEKMLQDNIEKHFGCVFINNELSHKTNQLLAPYIYEQIRNQEWHKLAPFRLL